MITDYSKLYLYAGDSIHLYGYLVVDVWDHDSTNPDDFLGRVMIPLGEIPSNQPNETWYPLMKRNTKDGKISGSLKLSIQLLVDETTKVFITVLCLVCSLIFSPPSLSLPPSLPSSILPSLSYGFFELNQHHSEPLGPTAIIVAPLV